MSHFIWSLNTGLTIFIFLISFQHVIKTEGATYLGQMFLFLSTLFYCCIDVAICYPVHNVETTVDSEIFT